MICLPGASATTSFFWADGGPTCLDNLVLLCGRHHTVIHHGEWEARLGEDGC
jgi:hypothetical protein